MGPSAPRHRGDRGVRCLGDEAQVDAVGRTTACGGCTDDRCRGIGDVAGHPHAGARRPRRLRRTAGALRPSPASGSFHHGSTFVPLTRHAGGIKAFKQIMPVGSGTGPPDLQVHEGYEWLYVLSGRLRLVLADRKLVLEPGEAAEFDTRVPHGIGNAGSTPVEILNLFGVQGERVHVRGGARRPPPRPPGAVSAGGVSGSRGCGRSPGWAGPRCARRSRWSRRRPARAAPAPAAPGRCAPPAGGAASILGTRRC